jgi:hypothetical protein
VVFEAGAGLEPLAARRLAGGGAATEVPPAAKASANRPAHNGVCDEGFRTTALPAMIAGTTLFTEVR